jgi:photosystem II stability/assembly factor-like uncharacterized protein
MHWLFILCAALTAGSALPLSSAFAAEALRPTAVAENFYGVEIVNDHAWIVGYYGAILHSRDRGATWMIQSSPTRSALYGPRFIDQKIGWIVGSFGTLLRTDDGGGNWHIQATGSDEHLFSLAWLDERTGVAVGSRGTILRTNNGGAVWTDKSLPEDITLNGIAFVGAKRGWITAEFGAIFHSEDGGASWRKQKNPVEVAIASGESQSLFALLFKPVGTGWAFGLDGVILNSRGGSSWEVIRRKQNSEASFEANHLFAAAQIDGRLWAVGERGTLLHAGADGREWRQLKLDIPRVSLNAIAFNKDGFGLAVGNRGVVLRTLDGGKSWSRLKINIPSSDTIRNRFP